MSMVARAKQWTLDELHRLPDDGNKYEVVFGELFVTPPPSEEHETILARLNAALVPCRDLASKRELYLSAGAAEYWAIDPVARNVRVIRAGREDTIVDESVSWAPRAAPPLVISVPALFGAEQ
jgi:Uma2 family endonuclease